MRIRDSSARQLLATVLDGRDVGNGSRVETKTCPLCGNFMVRFQSSGGLSSALGIAEESVVCVTTEGGMLGGACPGALRAAPLLGALKRGTKR